MIVPVDRQPVFRDALTGDNLADIDGKVRESGHATALLVELAERKRPTRFLPAPMLPDHSIEPALNPAGQVEVSRVNAQHQALINDAIIEPIGQDKLNAK